MLYCDDILFGAYGHARTFEAGVDIRVWRGHNEARSIALFHGFPREDHF